MTRADFLKAAFGAGAALSCATPNTVPRDASAKGDSAPAGSSLRAEAATRRGSKLVEIRPVDELYLMLHFLDGEVVYKDDGEGTGAFMGHESGGGDTIIRHQPELDTARATQAASYTLSSDDDERYRAGLRPKRVFRKSKVNGTDKTWPEANYTVEHTLFLELPHPLEQGRSYELAISEETNSNTLRLAFRFDVFRQVSEAIHVNIIGYQPDQPVKAADLYMWLGDGGARDYSSYAGRRVLLYDMESEGQYEVGTVTFWKRQGSDCGNWDYTKSDVYTCDFSSFTGTGKYRLVIEGIGASPEFEIRPDVYYEPFKTSVRGFFYMRIGMDKSFHPPPRQPRFIPDVDPPGFKVYRTTFGPMHPDWRKLRGDVWDKKDEWVQYREPGEPTNPDAWGGHSDALDWDRHHGHVPIIWDLLLPYLLSNGKIGEDDLEIPESGNGIPDVIDEALYEVDFWLRLRDGKGRYSYGLNNPSNDHLTMHQAAAGPYMAWVNAANCAMMADCFRIAGRKDLMERYLKTALEAWEIAREQDLDVAHTIGNGRMRGRDLKMMAAAFLYNVTGKRSYEELMARESVVKGPTSMIDSPYSHCQYWGTAAYLMCDRYGWQKIRYPELVHNMRASILFEAMEKNVKPSRERPSRRSSDTAYGWFQSTQMVHPLCIAHASSGEPEERRTLLEAMLLEADWSLGRNPMNMVQMTGLGSRAAEHIYTSGQNDGVPGVHPGHTPYMNAQAWGKGYMADPQWYASKGYPEWKEWPHGEALWPARYCFANNEFTPQQTMRGKMALLGYLYALGEKRRAT